MLGKEYAGQEANRAALTELFSVRRAELGDLNDIVDLVNEAYEVEKFFVQGPRTSAAAIEDAVSEGEFLLIDSPTGLSACVHLEVDGASAHFGLLSVSPRLQGRGLGRRLVALAEQVASSQGCTQMDIHVVNLRRGLLGFYAGEGYRAVGTAAFPDEERTTREVHFIRMQKALGN